MVAFSRVWMQNCWNKGTLEAKMRGIIFYELSVFWILLAWVALVAGGGLVWVQIAQPLRASVAEVRGRVGVVEGQVDERRGFAAMYEENAARLAELAAWEVGTIFEELERVSQGAGSFSAGATTWHGGVYEVRAVAEYAGAGAVEVLLNGRGIVAFSLDFGGEMAARAEMQIFGR
jgi:hypothetical protein